MFDSLYIHVPFCASKCSYCAFYSETGSDRKTRLAWLNKIDLKLREHAGKLTKLTSIFIGGGTPTLFAPKELSHLLESIQKTLSPARLQEFTFECNPETMTEEKAQILAQYGVNRVSLGVQSFKPKLRQTLGRDGSADSAKWAVDLLTTAGISNLGADLIYGIPGQTVQDWENDLRQACEMRISHLSAYALTIEEGTRLSTEKIDIPDDERTARMWELTGTVSADFGMERYEISNYAVPGKKCRHNDQIWHGATYLGLGPAASSFDGSRRWTQPASLTEWLADSPPETDELPPEERACELLAFGMRTISGWNLDDFSRRTGYSITQLCGKKIEDLISQGLVELSSDHLRPTHQGLLFADTVALALL